MAMSIPPLESYALRTHEKLRYADTDRQGHVNNAVFATMLETGRVELLYSLDKPVYSEGCTFVLASLHLDFLGEINWPGQVDVGTRVASVGKSSVTFEQGLFQKGECVATAKTVVVQMNVTTRRSHPLSEESRQRFGNFIPVVPE